MLWQAVLPCCGRVCCHVVAGYVAMLWQCVLPCCGRVCFGLETYGNEQREQAARSAVLQVWEPRSCAEQQAADRLVVDHCCITCSPRLPEPGNQ